MASVCVFIGFGVCRRRFFRHVVHFFCRGISMAGVGRNGYFAGTQIGPERKSTRVRDGWIKTKHPVGPFPPVCDPEPAAGAPIYTTLHRNNV